MKDISIPVLAQNPVAIRSLKSDNNNRPDSKELSQCFESRLNNVYRKRIFIKLFKLSIIILIFICPSQLFGQQLREFSSDTAEFIIQFSDFMKDVNDEEKIVLNNFLYAWEIDSFSFEDKTRFISSSNHMLRRRARPSPQFIDFLKIMNLYLDPELSSHDFNNWLSAYENLISGKTNINEIYRAQKLVYSIIEDTVIYDIAGTKWAFQGDDFSFKIKNDFPLIEFPDVDLQCEANKDTIRIYQTKGNFDPVKLVWIGENGIVTWEKAGLDPDLVYAELKNYKLEINRTLLNADSVQFYYTKYFRNPLEGRLEDQCRQSKSPDKSLFPKFYSYQNEYEIPDLFKGIGYRGGLSMQGAKLVGTGIGDSFAELDIFDGDTLRMLLKSKNIVIKEHSISSFSSSIKIVLENDSVYHPDLQFIYVEETNEVRLTKGESYTSGVPYTDTYHKINMNFEELSWKPGEGLMYLKPAIGSAIGQASFESYNFFNYNFYDELQGRDLSNPLVLLFRLSRQLNGWREFPVTTYAQNIGKPDYQVRHQLMKLSRLGFVYFDESKDMVKLLDKLFYYIEASIGRTDYDVIYFISRVNAPKENGTLNLRNYDLTIKGIPNIFLSDSQNVVLVPNRNEIIMKRNRNFQFDGNVRAGLLDMYGSNFFFEYDSFKINLQSIDSMRISVQEYNANTGVRNIEEIDNLIQNLTGEIVIDNPGNKSGLETFPEYPVFRSRENSYVYFDDPGIQGGVYDRNKVFFEVYPFEFDSLDNFARHGMNLKGRFESDGLLPPLEQTLVLQEDNSLGFRYTTPEQGIPVYNGLATFHNDISMSSHGLHGLGRLEYLTSVTVSNDFVFHPDSMTTISNDFVVNKKISGTQFPKVNSSNNDIKWLVNKGDFNIRMQDIPFTMFEDSIRLKGDLVLRSEGLFGKGNFDMVTSSLNSNKFKYYADRVIADTADFHLKSSVSQKLAIATENIRANIDFSNKSGQFFANEDYTLVDFQDLVYESRLDFFKWDMQDEVVEMGLNKPIERDTMRWDDHLAGPRYLSKLPSQDSLNFVAPKAIYDYKQAKLFASEVPYIQVADARIFPKEGNLVVGRHAVMDQLTEARILTNYTTKYYELFDASVSIHGKYDYSASAKYSYVDLTKSQQIIQFNKISVDETRQTFGSGEIAVKDSFNLSPFFGFMGQVRLKAAEQFLTFDGGVRLNHRCDLGHHWLKFEASINPDSIIIPVEEKPVDYDMNPTYIGTMISRDSTHVYSTFASRRKNYFDNYIATSYGIMRYNRFLERYEVGPEEKLLDMDVQGNYYSLDNNTCQVFSEGDMNLQLDFGQVKLRSVGTAVNDIDEHTFDMRLMMGLDFHFSAEALMQFANDLDSLPGLEAADPTDPFYQKSMVMLVGKDAADRMAADLGLYAEYRVLPPEFNKKILLSDVKLSWNQLTRTYRYHGDITVVKIGDNIVNKRVEAYIELTKRASGDLMDIYLKLDDRNFYYLGYNPGSLQVLSSNRIFNNIVFDLKASERKLKVRHGSTGYIYSLAAERRHQLFLRRFMASETNTEEN